MKRYEIWVNSICSTIIEAENREQALEIALELSDMRVVELKKGEKSILDKNGRS